MKYVIQSVANIKELLYWRNIEYLEGWKIEISYLKYRKGHQLTSQYITQLSDFILPYHYTISDVTAYVFVEICIEAEFMSGNGMCAKNLSIANCWGFINASRYHWTSEITVRSKLQVIPAQRKIPLIII